jgi:hypothetical protein
MVRTKQTAKKTTGEHAEKTVHLISTSQVTDPRLERTPAPQPAANKNTAGHNDERDLVRTSPSLHNDI